MKTLPNKIVEVKPIVKARGMVKDPNHIAYFMMPGVTIELTVPRTRMGTLASVLSKEETEFLESPKSGLGLSSGDLSVHKQKNNFWQSKKAKVILTDRGLKLNLSDPMDYIRYKILLSNKDLVAPDKASMKDKATYIFYISSKADEVGATLSRSSMLKKAYKYSSSIEGNRKKLEDTLIVYGKKPSKTMTNEQLLAEVDKIIDNDVKGFLKSIEDPLFEEKVTIIRAVENGLIEKKGSKFYTTTGEPLSNDYEPSTLLNAAKFLKSPKNQELYLTLTAKLEEIDS